MKEYLEMARSSQEDDRAEASRQLQYFLDQPEAVAALAELLGDSDWRVRRAAVDSFLEARLPETLPRIIDALHDEKNAGRRNAALDILSRFGKDIIPLAGDYLESSHPDIRMFFLSILGEMSDSTYLDKIVANLDHDNTNVVSAAILALGKIGHAGSIPRLLNFLSSDNLWLQFQALEALSEIQDPSVIANLIPLHSSSYCRKAVIRALSRFHHEDAYEALIRFAFQDETPDSGALAALIDLYDAPQPSPLQELEQHKIRKQAQKNIGERQQATLLRLAGSGSAEQRRPIIEILSWLEYEKAIPVFVTALQNPELAEAAETGLIPFGPVAGPYLLPLLNEVTEDERLATILLLLDRLQVPFEEKPIVPLLTHPASEVRDAAYRILLKTPLDVAPEHLLNGIADTWPSIHEGCIQALLERCRRQPQEKNEIFRNINELTHSDNAIQRAHAIEFLALSGEGDIVSFLTQAWKDVDPYVRRKAVAFMGRFYCPPYKKILITALADEDSTVREASARALSHDSSSDVVEALLSGLHDESIWVRIAVYEYLTSTPDDSHLDLLLQKLHAEHPAAQAALIRGMNGRGGASVREILFRFLESEDPEIRKCACLALGHYPARETEDLLIHMLRKDEEWGVRNAAVHALMQIRPDQLSALLVDRLQSDSDPSVRKEILKALQSLTLDSIPDVLFALLIHPDLSSSTYAFFLAQREFHRAQLAAALHRQKPAVRRILQALSS